MITGKNYIGNDLSSKGTHTYTTLIRVLNKANQTTFFEASPEEIDQAIILAEKAYDTYSVISGSQKRNF